MFSDLYLQVLMLAINWQCIEGFAADISVGEIEEMTLLANVILLT